MDLFVFFSSAVKPLGNCLRYDYIVFYMRDRWIDGEMDGLKYFNPLLIEIADVSHQTDVKHLAPIRVQRFCST